jgi:hypothetical protein
MLLSPPSKACTVCILVVMLAMLSAVYVLLFLTKTSFSWSGSIAGIATMHDPSASQHCFDVKYIVWQPHGSGMGSNLALGYAAAAGVAAYLNRTLVMGEPPENWMYLNKRQQQQLLRSRILSSSSSSSSSSAYAGDRFWEVLFDKAALHPCAEIVSRVVGKEVSSVEELEQNEAFGLVVSLDYGIDYSELIDNDRIANQAPPGSISSMSDLAKKATQELFASAISREMYLGFVMREASIFVEHGVPHIMTHLAVTSSIGLHMRGGDKISESHRKIEAKMFYDLVQHVYREQGSACLVYKSGSASKKNESWRNNVVSLPFDDAPDPWELSNGGKKFGEEPKKENDEQNRTLVAYFASCRHPCVVHDLFFDMHMLGLTQVLFTTEGSCMSALISTLQMQRRGGDRLHLPLPLTKDRNSTIHGFIQNQKLLSGASALLVGDNQAHHTSSSRLVDILKSDRRRVGVVILPTGTPATLFLSLASVHPSVFLYHNDDDDVRHGGLGIGGITTHNALLSCALAASPNGVATPGVLLNDSALAWVAAAACNQRPVRIELLLAEGAASNCSRYRQLQTDRVVLKRGQSTRATSGSSSSTSCLALRGSDVAFLDRYVSASSSSSSSNASSSTSRGMDGFVELMRVLQRFFGLDDVLSETALLQWWWDNHHRVYRWNASTWTDRDPRKCFKLSSRGNNRRC